MGTTPRWGEVAQGNKGNPANLSLGTKIWVEPAIKGRHHFTIEDRFGGEGAVHAAGRLDVWTHCGDPINNPWERFRVIR